MLIRFSPEPEMMHFSDKCVSTVCETICRNQIFFFNLYTLTEINLDEQDNMNIVSNLCQHIPVAFSMHRGQYTM